MHKLNPFFTGISAALTLAIGFSLCALSFALIPDPTLGFFDAWFHGLDLKLLKPEQGVGFTVGEFLYGLVGVSLTGFFTGFVFATIDNLWRQ